MERRHGPMPRLKDNEVDVIPYGLPFETGFCHYCRYETETKPYPIGPQILDKDGGAKLTEKGFYIFEDVWLCEFCCMLSRNDMKEIQNRVINWGMNHIMKEVRKCDTNK